ncbi:hypothetical protein CHARACLAT_021080 [Characodon lateralis]|uniref:Uncharacterized protein n=1 Tax=Characodon lateralis TaxID=208331 RepID=A0ABU7DJ01_9TELE|nr:hypothetical protein [Characodon lateralis]
MTAVASFRSQGVVGYRKYEALVIIITLLSLLCPANSWIGKSELQNIKENIQKLQEDAAMRRVGPTCTCLSTLLLLDLRKSSSERSTVKQGIFSARCQSQSLREDVQLPRKLSLSSVGSRFSLMIPS